MTQEHPAKTHQRSIALVRHAARRDRAAYGAVLAEVIGPEAVAAQLLSLVQLAGLLTAEIPAETREQLLDEAMHALVQAQQVPRTIEVQALLLGGPFDGNTATFSVDPDTEAKDTLLLPDPKSQVGRLAVYQRAGVAEDGRWIYQFDASAVAIVPPSCGGNPITN